MITFITILIAASVVLLDYLFYRRTISGWNNRFVRIVTVAALAVTDLLPVFSAVIFWLIDNSQLTMAIGMWINTFYFLSVLPRIAFYVGFLPIRNRRTGLPVGAVLCTIVLSILLVSVLHTRKNIEVKECELKFASLPAAFDGYRIAFFSDLHVGAMINPEKEIRSVVDRINGLHPDLVIFGGDLVNIRYTELSDEIIRILGGIDAPDGVVSVMGNHDTGIYIKDTIAMPRAENVRMVDAAMKDMGWTPLRDSTVYVARGGDSISITGLDFTDALLEYRHSFSVSEEYDTKPVFADVPDSVFNVTVSHMPQLWRNITDANHGNLTLAGHVHATQVKLECEDIRISPAMLMYKEWSGLYGEGEHRLYINDGVGNVGFYMRIGARPEITLLKLRN